MQTHGSNGVWHDTGCGLRTIADLLDFPEFDEPCKAAANCSLVPGGKKTYIYICICIYIYIHLYEYEITSNNQEYDIRLCPETGQTPKSLGDGFGLYEMIPTWPGISHVQLPHALDVHAPRKATEATASREPADSVLPCHSG